MHFKKRKESQTERGAGEEGKRGRFGRLVRTVTQSEGNADTLDTLDDQWESNQVWGLWRVLLWDTAGAHIAKPVIMCCFALRLFPVSIPGNCTDLGQTLDRKVMKSYKRFSRESFTLLRAHKFEARGQFKPGSNERKSTSPWVISREEFIRANARSVARCIETEVMDIASRDLARIMHGYYAEDESTLGRLPDSLSALPFISLMHTTSSR